MSKKSQVCHYVSAKGVLEIETTEIVCTKILISLSMSNIYL